MGCQDISWSFKGGMNGYIILILIESEPLVITEISKAIKAEVVC